MRKAFHILVILVAFVVSGCTESRVRNRETGALAGGALGAGLGAIIGHATGRTGEGIAIGAGAGALTGGLVGNELDRQEDYQASRRDQLSSHEEELRQNRMLLEELRNRGLDAHSSERGVIVNLPDVLFEFDSARLTSDARRKVHDIVIALRNTTRRSISVEGHTDSVGREEYNLRLSRNRAYSVADALVEQGIGKDRLFVRGLGEANPVASNDSARGRTKNRRVEVIVENRR